MSVFRKGSSASARGRCRVPFLAMFACVLGWNANSAEAQSECQFAKLSAPCPQPLEFYGDAVSVSGSRLVVGAFARQIGLSTAGAAFVYERCGPNWFLTDTFTPPVFTAPSFGVDVAIEDDTLVVGTKFDSAAASQAGSAYVYEHDGIRFKQTGYLLPSVPFTSMNFGTVLEIAPGLIFVGAPNDSTVFSSEGSVYVYELIGSNWVEVQILRPQPSGGVFFGDSIAEENGELFVGARGSNLSEGEVFAYVYDGAQWVLQQNILVSNPAVSQDFGIVSFDGEILAVGAPASLGPLGSNSGLVVIFERGDGGLWEEVQQISPPPSSTASLFGQAVCVDGDRLAVGAGFDSAGARLGGAVHLYNKVGATWTLVSTLTAQDAMPSDGLAAGGGNSGVSMDGDFLVAGAILGDSSVMDSGAAYTWSLSGTTCPTLAAAPPRVSLAMGGAQQIRFDAGIGFAQSPYWIVGGISGTDPGFTFAGLRVPINIDDYFDLSLIPGPSNPLLSSMGTLNGEGSATAVLVVAPGSDPSLVGLEISHAAIAYSLNPLSLGLISNPTSLSLGP